MYFKVTNFKEKHHGFQYVDGLNILEGDFNADSKKSCCSGGLYFTTKEFIHKFYLLGINLRIVELPMTDPEFKMVQNSKGDKYRANKIFLREKYSLAHLDTYKKFGIQLPTIEYCMEHNFIDLLMHILDSRPFNAQNTLYLAVKYGYPNIFKYLIEKGADCNLVEKDFFYGDLKKTDLEILEYLYSKIKENKICIDQKNSNILFWNITVGRGFDFKRIIADMTEVAKNNPFCVQYCNAENSVLKLIKCMVKQGLDPHVNNDYYLKISHEYQYQKVVDFLNTID